MNVGGVELELGELIDRGGMAEVYAATSSDGDELAVKILNRILALQPEFVSMFHDEAAITRELDHPNIVRVRSSGTIGELPALVMERLRGPSLRDIIHRSRGGARANLGACLLVGWQVASALGYAHKLASPDGVERKLVHRDVSPSNIIVDESGAAKLIDFGIAKAALRLSERTRTGILKGKDGYMSPEQCLGGRLDHRSDIFSLGVVLYELLTGHALFRREALENSFTVMERVTSGRVPEAPLDIEGLDSSVKNIVLRCLEQEPDDRYASADELAEALATAIEAATAAAPQHQSSLLHSLGS